MTVPGVNLVCAASFIAAIGRANGSCAGDWWHT